MMKPADEVSPQSGPADRLGLSHVRRPVEELGCPRRPHTPEIVGSESVRGYQRWEGVASMGRGGWTAGRVEFDEKTRRRILRRDKVCRMCSSRPATQADHVIPIAEGGRNAIDNGQGLCAACHEVKTRAEIERGKARAARRNRRRPPERHPGLVGGVG